MVILTLLFASIQPRHLLSHDDHVQTATPPLPPLWLRSRGGGRGGGWGGGWRGGGPGPVTSAAEAEGGGSTTWARGVSGSAWFSGSVSQGAHCSSIESGFLAFLLRRGESATASEESTERASAISRAGAAKTGAITSGGLDSRARTGGGGVGVIGSWHQRGARIHLGNGRSCSLARCSVLRHEVLLDLCGSFASCCGTRHRSRRRCRREGSNDPQERRRSRRLCS